MRVKKRSGNFELVSFDKITRRFELFKIEHVNIQLVAQKVIQGIYDGVSTKELDNLGAETAAYMSTIHPNYEKLAKCIAVSNLHKETGTDFAYSYMSEEIVQIIKSNIDLIMSKIDFNRDYDYSYFGFKTLCKGYLLPGERPQHMLMRVSIGIFKNNLTEAFNTYEYMSKRIFTHASPTMFNAGTPNPQCASCFLLSMDGDSIEGIYSTLGKCAKISAGSGGIGFNVHTIRAEGAKIKGSNGVSGGLLNMLKVYNSTARYVNQAGKRKGAFAVYIEPWHADIFTVLELKKNTGPDELRARDLFYGLWIPDLFMKRVEENGIWSLMCPNDSPGLCDVYGDEFEELYQRYESEGRYKRQIKAQELWFLILELQIESGGPYMLYKDAANRKSNQKNLGTIRNSNLCTEIIQFTSPEEIAVCNLASISLKAFVKTDNGVVGFDYPSLSKAVSQLVRNLNQVIDISKYTHKETEYSNFKNRPIGIGVQGLAETFFLMRFPFDSPEAADLNKKIFEEIYFAACSESNELAKVYGPYESFPGSPASKGILQFDMWGHVCPRFDNLKESIIKYGMRNSLLVAPMPTASTSQILGNTECFEPIAGNICSRTTLAGSFTMVNTYLVEDLQKIGMWNDAMKNLIIMEQGSIQNIPDIPLEIRNLYKTAFEITQKTIIQMSADRGVFIDQSQSLNIHKKDPTFEWLTSVHFYGFKLGLKTGMYYLRTKPAADAIQFTVSKPSSELVCSRDDPSCMSCSS